MTEPTTREKLAAIRANIFADAVVRAVRWLAWAAILCAIVLPLAFDAWREAGPLAGLVVLALCLALCWHVKPEGASYRARCRDIDRERWPRE